MLKKILLVVGGGQHVPRTGGKTCLVARQARPDVCWEAAGRREAREGDCISQASLRA